MISRHSPNYRRAISPAERLALCRRFLATGDSYRTIAYSYRVGVSTVAGVISQVCEAIWDVLVQEVMPVPTIEDWTRIAEGFQSFTNCPGAIDGKHVVIGAPDHSGFPFYNYKGTYSVVLLAVVDAEYCFRVFDVGSYGRSSDGGTLVNSALVRGTLGLHPNAALPGAEHLGLIYK